MSSSASISYRFRAILPPGSHGYYLTCSRLTDDFLWDFTSGVFALDPPAYFVPLVSGDPLPGRPGKADIFSASWHVDLSFPLDSFPAGSSYLFRVHGPSASDPAAPGPAILERTVGAAKIYLPPGVAGMQGYIYTFSPVD